MKRPKACPECGGIPFAGATLVYEHRDLFCSMRWNGTSWVPMKLVKWVRTSEDWYPTIQGNAVYPNPDYCNPLPDPAVRVFMTQLSTKEWRVAVWGGDDFGLEIDLPDGHKLEAQHLFDNIVDFTTQQQLKDWGFRHA